jgi:antitoxin FitA
VNVDPTWGHGYHRSGMAEVKIRKLDDDVARALRSRAQERGVSLEEEARRTLGDSVAQKLQAFARRAAASRAATRPSKGKQASDSTVLIRKDRDAWG